MDNVKVLKVDRDCYVDEDWIRDYVHLVLLVCQWHGLTVPSIKMTETRKGLHFYIRITPDVEPELANRLQFLLSDDARRVDFNRARIESELNQWNLLFEPADVRLRTIYNQGSGRNKTTAMKEG